MGTSEHWALTTNSDEFDPTEADLINLVAKRHSSSKARRNVKQAGNSSSDPRWENILKHCDILARIAHILLVTENMRF
jgi:hypothetical protein